MSLNPTRLISIVALGILAFTGSHAFAAPAARIQVSNNWAGYIAADTSYTGVSGSWTVPDSVPTDNTISADATWIGIGGVTKNDLIQAGTQAIVRDGRTEYTAWYETLPDTQQTTSLAIHAGDQISASVNEVRKGLWLITITNFTTGQRYQNTVAYDSSHSSAEWIVERPLAITGQATGYLPLSNFDQVTFTDATATTTDGQTIHSEDANAQAVVMGGTGSRLLAAPDSIADASFVVSYLSPSQSSRYLQTLRRSYTIHREMNAASRAPVYQDINTNYIVHVTF